MSHILSPSPLNSDEDIDIQKQITREEIDEKFKEVNKVVKKLEKRIIDMEINLFTIMKDMIQEIENIGKKHSDNSIKEE